MLAIKINDLITVICFQVWIFGSSWCRAWLALDVWMCTASILNLCAISLDRYVAVTRPVAYPSIMSTKRAKGLIGGLWVLSFVICFPPLVGWKDKKVRVGFLMFFCKLSIFEIDVSVLNITTGNVTHVNDLSTDFEKVMCYGSLFLILVNYN